MDPWAPIPEPHSSGLDELDSENYVASLEARLSRLKESRNREPTAKDLLDGLSEAKEAEMNNLTQASDDPYLSSYTDSNDASIENPSLVTAIQRKLQPEKQALSTEEVMELLENDELAKTRQQSEEHNQETGTRQDLDNNRIDGRDEQVL